MSGTEDLVPVYLEASNSGHDGCGLGEAAMPDAPSLSVCSSEEVTRALKLKSEMFETALGTFAVRGAMASNANAEAFTIQSLVSSTSERSTDNTSVSVGVTDRLFGGALTLRTDLAWTQDSTVWREGEAATATIVAQERVGSARWHAFEARLVDTADIRWSASGEFASVDEDFVANPGARAPLTLSIPGERTRIASSLKLWDVTLSGVSDQGRNALGERELERLKMSIDGIEAQVSTLRVERFSPLEPNLVRNSDSFAVGLELLPAVLIPDAMSALGDAAGLVPDLISLEWETGVEGLVGNAAQDATVDGFQAVVSWSGSLGETTALYWQERDVPIAENLSSERVFNRLFDFSHVFRRGDWSVGGGVSLVDLGSNGGETAFSDSAISGHVSVAHTPARGPQIRMSAGHDTDRFAFGSGEEVFESRQTSLNLSLSVDFAPLVRHYLDRPGLHIKLEYRREFDAVEETGTDAQKEGEQALLISLGGSL